MGLNPGLPDHWRKLYSLGQWAGSIYIYIYIYIYNHLQTDYIVIPQLFGVATPTRYFKLGLKPRWLYVSRTPYPRAIIILRLDKGTFTNKFLHCELNYHDQKIRRTPTHDIRKHWTAVSTLLGLISNVYRDLHHWKSNQRSQIANVEFLWKEILLIAVVISFLVFLWKRTNAIYSIRQKFI